jgi:2-oxoglutarate dehydrogenase E2 component (dihydrolipoamide succinyltransferase)
MKLDIKVPSPGESISEVEIADWLVKDGDFVEKDQPIAEMDSDKATLEIPAEESGIISINVEVGETIKVGEVIGHIDTNSVTKKESEKPSNFAKSITKSEKPIQEINYANGFPSPSAKKIIDENGIDLESVKGTGKGGRILKEDVIKKFASQNNNQDRSISRRKLSLLRRKVSERLVNVKNETAMLTTFNEVDMSSIFSLRSDFKEKFSKKFGVGLGFMSFFTKAVVRALQDFPDVNSVIDGSDQIFYNYCDISIAVSGPKGLMVPVVRSAEKLNFREIESEIKRLAVRAREGEITVDEMSGGTFTISNGGVFGSMLSTPIINPPQSAILGMHNIIQRPIAVNGKVEIRPMMYLALSYDHRIIDGKESVGFLLAIKESLESPVDLLMDGNAKKALEL